MGGSFSEMSDEILARLEEIRNLTALQVKEMLTVDDVALMTGYSRRYVLKLANTGLLPYYKPFDKALFFKKEEVNKALSVKRVASIQELINENLIV